MTYLASERRSETVRNLSRRPGHDPARVEPSISQAGLLSLQRLAGNRAVAGLLADRAVRPVVLQRSPAIQRFAPEDVAGEMVGQQFELTEAFKAGPISVAVGDKVEIVDWQNAPATVRARLPAPAPDRTPFDVPKRILRPVHPTGSLAQYGTDIGSTTAAVAAGQKKIEAEQGRKGGPRSAELARLETLQKNRERLLNRKLIQETMFNRFDPIIQTWTAHYNSVRKGADPLDPNLVKSLLYQESEMGTSGRYLGLGDPVRTQFNIGQAIDSSAEELLIMIREIQPALIAKYHLASIDTDLESAKKELKNLSRPGHPTAAEQPRHDELVALSEGYWETFLWNYHAAGQSKGFKEAVDEFFTTHAAGAPDLNLDYEFWIRTTIRWLFQKRKGTKSWDEAIRAYNGSGAAARAYRDAVTRRAADAATAEAAGTEFVPTR